MPQSPTPAAASRHALGAFYTPPQIAAHMASLLEGLGPTSRILEPAGGDGALARAVLATARVEPAQVDVWDTNPEVSASLSELGVNFARRDSLLDPPPPADVYTHTIGNPPYLNKQSTYVKDHRIELRSRYAAIGANDTYAMFALMALQQLQPGGQLVFLLSDTFLTLGAYRRLRELLLAETTMRSVTLLPAGSFPGAAVRTAILDLLKSPPPPAHEVVFIDARATGDLHPVAGSPTRTRVPQLELATNVGASFAFTPEHRQALRIMEACPALMSVCDGGLGMFTRDNATFLAVVTRGGRPAAPLRPGQKTVTPAQVDGVAWRYYHKRGGAQRWWGPAEHAVAWDTQSRTSYATPTTATTGQTSGGHPRAGVVISGVATTLTARLATPGALWESNKAFCLFPRDPDTHPPAFLCAILNSAWYTGAARALNHTVSFQSRDLARLPLLPFTPAEVRALASWGDAQVAAVREGLPGTHQGDIDRTVAAAAGRALDAKRRAPTSPRR